MTLPRAVIFDVGRVLFDWNLRFLYERLIPDDEALDAFLGDVVTAEWHFQHDAGRPFAETSAELIAEYPHHADLIRALGPRFNETIGGAMPGADAPSYLSGLIVGADVGGALALFEARRVMLVCAPALAALYARALAFYDVRADGIDGDAAALAGLVHIHSELF